MAIKHQQKRRGDSASLGWKKLQEITIIKTIFLLNNAHKREFYGFQNRQLSEWFCRSFERASEPVSEIKPEVLKSF